MSKRNNPDYPFRDRHDDLLETEWLCERFELIKTVQSMTGASFDEVLKRSHSHSVSNRSSCLSRNG